MIFIVGGLVLQCLAWANQPSTAWPLFGFVGIMTIFLWTIVAIVDGMISQKVTWLAWYSVVGWIALFGTGIAGWSMFNANTYATMIGPMETRVWTRRPAQGSVT